MTVLRPSASTRREPTDTGRVKLAALGGYTLASAANGVPIASERLRENIGAYAHRYCQARASSRATKITAIGRPLGARNTWNMKMLTITGAMRTSANGANIPLNSSAPDSE